MQADMSSTITQVETLQSYLEKGFEGFLCEKTMQYYVNKLRKRDGNS